MPAAAVAWALVIATVLFGGPVFGGLVMNDLNGHTYTVTAVHLGSGPVTGDPVGLRIWFRDGRITWPSGCNEASSAYRITWTTLELTGPSVSTAMGCEGESSSPGAALGRMLRDQPSVRVQEENRVVLESASGTIDLLESS